MTAGPDVREHHGAQAAANIAVIEHRLRRRKIPLREARRGEARDACFGPCVGNGDGAGAAVDLEAVRTCATLHSGDVGVVVTAPRAYALPMVLVLAALLAAALGLFLRTAENADRTSTRLFRRQEAQVALAGTTRATAVAAGGFLLSQPGEPDPLPSDPVAKQAALDAYYAALQTNANVFLDALKPSVTPAGMTLDTMALTRVAPRRVGEIQEGAFRGMNGLIQPFDLEVQGRHLDLRDGSLVALQAQAERVFIPMFQFFAFIDGYAFVFNGPGAKFFGRVHANDNMCIGSGQDSFFETITSAGKIYRLKGSGCRNEISGGLDGGVPKPTVFVSTNGFPTPPSVAGALLLDKDADSPSWLTDVDAWHVGAIAHVADSTHGIPRLKPPITGAPVTQMGRNALHALSSNNNNSRFLVDPVLTVDPPDVARQKIAFKADLRIIDGIWYKRDPADPTRLGTPIWSDHPGKMFANHPEDVWVGLGKNVGQDDLFSSTRPLRYSYYRTTAPGRAELAPLTAGVRPVVSYGALFRTEPTAGKPRWVPGFYEATSNNGASQCTTITTTSGVPCYVVKQATTTAQLLQGTRSGFRSAWDESGLTDGAADCGADRAATYALGTSDERRTAQVNMLPINVDVAALQEALADTGAGELGAHFGGGATFNGVVYVSATWPGFRDGYGTTSTSNKAGMWPFQGLQRDNQSGTPGTANEEQPADGVAATLFSDAVYEGLAFSPASGDIAPGVRMNNPPFQQALPYPLCTDDLASDLTTSRMAGYTNVNTFSGSGTDVRRFSAPLCAKYHDSSSATRLNARVNAVRVINARNLDPNILPKGLTIVSNLETYVLGSLNTTSGPGEVPVVVADVPGDSGVTPWLPVLIGGDSLSLLSNAWTDDEAPWNLPVRAYWHRRRPSDTQLNGAFLYGWAEAARGGGGDGCREELTYSIRLHEEWSQAAGIQRVIRGSIFVGWNSVYGAAFSDVHADENSGAWHDTDGSTKIYGYDYHFDRVTNQPPGAPQFELTNIKRVTER